MDIPRRSSRFFSRKNILPNLVLVCAAILSYLALIQPWSLRQTSLPLKVGEVASQDLRALNDVQYVSEVLTGQARDQAERAVAPVYGAPDATIGTTQVDALTVALQEITVIRNNQEWTADEKKTRLAELQEEFLRPESANLLLSLSDDSWNLVQAESLDLLSTVMQQPIRTEDLENVRRGLEERVSYTLTRSETGLVLDLISSRIIANSFYSPELTDAARQAARDAVEPVTRSYVQGQMVVARGQVITETDLEALKTLGLVEPETKLFDYLGPAALVLIATTFVFLYFLRRPRSSVSDLRSLIVLAALFLIFLVGARITIPNRTVVPYLFPIPAFALLLSALFGMERGLIFALLMSVLAAYGMPDTFGLLPYYILTSLCGVLALGSARRLMNFLYAAVAIAVAGMTMIVAYRLTFNEIDGVGMVTLAAAAIFMGVASASMTLPLQYLLSQFLGLTTALQLLETSRPDSPLLNYFLQRAPGTYQHSLQVANLAEQAAERIGADALLTRVGALFHDVGKAANPLFFVENQPPSQIDSHDDLDPQVSAETIIRHVTDGLELARHYRLPRRLHDFISEHHGTLITRYQYNRAVQAADGDATKVDETKFRYPGPSPRSKETALLMFADGVEARARAERPADDEQVRNIVRGVIERCRKDGQLDNTPLSQRDLAAITESFVATLRVTYHPRLEYPQETVSAAVEAPTTPIPRKTK